MMSQIWVDKDDAIAVTWQYAVRRLARDCPCARKTMAVAVAVAVGL